MRISDIPWEMVQQELYSWNRPLSLETVRLLDELFFSLEDTGERGDLILVFGSRRGFRYRGRQALRLYQAGRAPHILVSGGTRDPALPTEASLFRQGFREHGVPDEAILTEEMSRTTPENVANTAAMLRRRYGKTPLILLLVTAEFHMTRAYLTAKKGFPDSYRLVSCPAVSLHGKRDNWFATPLGRERLGRELQSLVAWIGSCLRDCGSPSAGADRPCGLIRRGRRLPFFQSEFDRNRRVFRRFLRVLWAISFKRGGFGHGNIGKKRRSSRNIYKSFIYCFSPYCMIL